MFEWTLLTLLSLSSLEDLTANLRESSIPFMVTQPIDVNLPSTLDGRHWRHNFDLLLTSTNDIISIFDEFGTRHDFNTQHIITQSSFIAEGLRNDSGTIHRDEDVISWVRGSGSIIEFRGSLPIRIETIDEEILSLEYSEGVLQRVVDSNNNALEFDYDQGLISYNASVTNQNSCEQHTNNSQATEDLLNHECDSLAHPQPIETQEPSFNGALAIDLRPASCNSYFVDYFGTTRGQQIEYGLDTHNRYQGYSSTVRSFPILDLIGENELLVVRSRDLLSTSYDVEIYPDGLYRRLLQDAADIQNIFIDPLRNTGYLETTENHVTTRVTQDILERPLVLEVIIQHGFATPAHIAQINQARDFIFENYGIELRVIEIP